MHQRGEQEIYQASGMTFYLYLPTDNRPPDGWPVLLFLHGVGEASWNFLRDQNRWQYQPLSVVKQHGSPPALCEARPLSVQALLRSFIVVSPQYPYVPSNDDKREKRRNWNWTDQVNNIDQMLSIVTTEFGGDAGRIYASGFSLGGKGVLEIAAPRRNGIRFAKIVAVDSASIPPQLENIVDASIPVWMHYGGRESPTFNAHQALVSRQVRGPWVDAAPNEPTPDSRYVITDWNQNHVDTCRSAYSDARVYEWLLRPEPKP